MCSQQAACYRSCATSAGARSESSTSGFQVLQHLLICIVRNLMSADPLSTGCGSFALTSVHFLAESAAHTMLAFELSARVPTRSMWHLAPRRACGARQESWLAQMVAVPKRPLPGRKLPLGSAGTGQEGLPSYALLSLERSDTLWRGIDVRWREARKTRKSRLRRRIVRLRAKRARFYKIQRWSKSCK